MKLVAKKLYRLWRKNQLAKISKLLSKSHGDVVLAGPFKGMKYCKDACVTFPPSKRVGSYECELAEIVQYIINNEYDRIIDVGSAEGYYAVGLLTRTKSSHMFAFETTDGDRDWLKQNAVLNGVSERLTIGSFCTPDVLCSLINGRTFLFSDCEGYEDILIDPAKCPSLYHTDMLVECHEDSIPGISEKLTRIFGPTHHISLIMPQLRESSRWEHSRLFPWFIRSVALSDIRSMSEGWLFMRVKGTS